MTWNIEGFQRNIHNFKELVIYHQPDLIMLSEIQMYKCDAEYCEQFLRGEYKCYVNSEDQFDPELPLRKIKAHGGTMMLWRASYDAFISVIQPPSPAILPVLFSPPNGLPSVHICVYLPTHGLDSQFLDEITKLNTLVYNLVHTYPSAPIYIRGDFNVNRKNLKRKDLLDFFQRWAK